MSQLCRQKSGESHYSVKVGETWGFPSIQQKIIDILPGEQMDNTHTVKRAPCLKWCYFVHDSSGYVSEGDRRRQCAARLMGGEANQIVSRPTTIGRVISCLDARIPNTHMHSESAAESKPSHPTPGNKYGEENTLKQPFHEPRGCVPRQTPTSCLDVAGIRTPV